MDAKWSRSGDRECIRVSGLSTGSTIEVRPATAALGHTAPAMAGRLVRDGRDVCFVPRYQFIDGTTYTVHVDGALAIDLIRPGPHLLATTEVAAIFPTARVVPRNLLRFYVWFTAPMSEGYAGRHVRLLDDSGSVMTGALLPTEYELWDRSRRRLTVLLDPARIKRGLLSHEQAGYPLQIGTPVRLLVDAGLHDADGHPLRGPAARGYEVGPDERRRVTPADWQVGAPRSGTDEHLRVAFDRPLDHGLLLHCLRVSGPGGRTVEGTVDIGPNQRSWSLRPRHPWAAGAHRIVVDPILEDLAGNSVVRIFDRDLTQDEEHATYSGPVTLPFRTISRRSAERPG